MVKVPSIILMALGALGIIVTLIPTLATKLPGIGLLSKPQLLILSVTLIIIGVLLLKPSKPKAPAEIPVYQGQSDQVVAYRRPAKK